MKNFIRTFGIIALVAVIGFSMAACGGGGSNNNNKDDNNKGSTDVNKLIGTWLKDSDNTIGVEFSDYRPDGAGDGPTIDFTGLIDYGDPTGWFMSNDGFIGSYNGWNSNGVISGASGDSIKTAFEGEKLKLSEFKGKYADSKYSKFEGLYTKTTIDW